MQPELQPTTETTKSVYSTTNHLQLIRYVPESYEGIHKDMQLHVIFPEGLPIVGFEGDQGLTKTSNLNCLIALMGGEDSMKAVNEDDNNKKAELEIRDTEDPSIRYVGRLTKSGYTVTMIQDKGGKLVRSSINSPKAFIQRLIGPIGVSPMFLKEKNGKEQIKWIRGLYNFTQEQLDLENQIIQKRDKHFKERTEANRELKFIKTSLVESTFFAYDNSQKALLPTEALGERQKVIANSVFDDNAINSKIQDVTKRRDAYKGVKVRLGERKEYKPQVEKAIETSKEKIERLKRELAIEEEHLALHVKDLKDVEQRIAEAEKWVAENVSVEKEYEDAQNLLKNSAGLKLQKKELDDTLAQKKKYDDKEREIERLEAALSECDTLQKEFIRSFTPEIEGLEIVVPGMSIGESDVSKPEGLYMNGRSLLQLSESELWDLCLQLWHIQKVRVVIIDNMTNLGSDAVSRINWFVKNGGRVFYSAMDRDVKELKITYLDEIS
jgi:hypothetical protein